MRSRGPLGVERFWSASCFRVSWSGLAKYQSALSPACLLPAPACAKSRKSRRSRPATRGFVYEALHAFTLLADELVRGYHLQAGTSLLFVGHNDRRSHFRRLVFVRCRYARSTGMATDEYTDSAVSAFSRLNEHGVMIFYHSAQLREPAMFVHY